MRVQAGASVVMPSTVTDTDRIEFNGSGGAPQVFDNQTGGTLFLNQVENTASGVSHMLSLVGTGGFDISKPFGLGNSYANFLQVASDTVLQSQLVVPSGVTVVVESGARLTVQGGVVVNSGGTLVVNPGGTLLVGAGQSVSFAGTLTLIGTSAASAMVQSVNGMSAYSVSAQSGGTFKGVNFRIDGAPLDLSSATSLILANGRFGNIAPGTTALRLGGSAIGPVTGLNFETDLNSVTYVPIDATNLISDALVVSASAYGTKDVKSRSASGAHLKWTY
jgi:hypothetical protein